MCPGWMRYNLSKPKEAEVCSELVQGGRVVSEGPQVANMHLRLLRDGLGVAEVAEVRVKRLKLGLYDHEVAKVCSRCLRYDRGHCSVRLCDD
jgi:hypothetical protein